MRRFYRLVHGLGGFGDGPIHRRLGNILGAKESRGAPNGAKFAHEVIDSGPVVSHTASATPAL
ncbi:MAG: hypothetical protein DMF77_25510 [Acidobacteria bacterium]|nr:MAG: hypothetical protein DMF77_25510 [Acidobacteriota bacterium]